jgi:hypothetical protein
MEEGILNNETQKQLFLHRKKKNTPTFFIFLIICVMIIADIQLSIQPFHPINLSTFFYIK